MLKIDMHAHILPDEIPDFSRKFGYEGFISLKKNDDGTADMMHGDRFFRKVQPNCINTEARLAECEEFDVDAQVVSTVPVMFNYWAEAEHALETSRFLNDHMAEVVQDYPKRFIGLGTVPLQSPDLAIKEMERCHKELRFPGLQIGSHVNQWNLNDPALFPFFEAAADMGVALMVHPWEMVGSEVMPQYWMPWLVGMPAETTRAICSMIFGGVLERLPHLRVLFAHGGGSFPATIGRIEHGFNVRPDLCAVDNDVSPRSYMDKFWVDSITHDAPMLDYLVKVMGKGKVAFGTDYPFPLGELEPGRLIDSMDFDEETKASLLYQSTLDWLNLKAEDYQR